MTETNTITAPAQDILRIALDHLVIHPLNVRAREPFNPESRQDDAALVESIRKRGVLQPIVVARIDDQTYGVIAGRRRLLALRAIGERLTVDARVLEHMSDAELAAASIDENDEREPLSAADTAMAVAGLAKAGVPDDEIALAVGQPLRTIKRLKVLGGVHPEILDYFREQGQPAGTRDVGEYDSDEFDDHGSRMTIEHLIAYAAEPDQDRQLEIHQQLTEKHKGNWYWATDEITTIIGGEPMPTDSRIGKLVKDEYLNQGYGIETDLFSETETFDRPDMALKIAEELLEAEMQKLREQGYGWVDGTLKDHDDRLNRLQAKTPAPRSRAGRAECGALVTLGYDGQFTHHRNLVSAQEARKAERKAKAQADRKAAGNDTDPDDTTPPIPAALDQDLSRVLFSALRLELITEPHPIGTALNLLAFELCRTLVGREYNRQFLDQAWLRTTQHADTMNSTAPGLFSRAAPTLVDDYPAFQAIAQAESDGEALVAFMKTPQDEREAATAVALAYMMTEPMVHRLRGALPGLMNQSVRNHWTPTAQNYFGRLRKAHLVQIAPELKSEEWCREQLPRLKVTQIAEALAEAAAFSDWLPPELRAPKAAGPDE